MADIQANDALYRLICLDVDGTLINDEKKITANTKAEIEHVVKTYNVMVTIVSARPPGSLHILMQELNLYHPIVCFNGALVLDKAPLLNDRAVLFSAFIANSDAHVMIDYAQEQQVHIGVYRYNDWYVDSMDYWATYEMKGTRVTPIISNLKEKVYNGINNHEGVHKIMLRGEAEKLDAAEAFARQQIATTSTIHRVKDTVLEITPTHISKATGVQLLCNSTGIAMKQVMAFGDSYNDIEMLKEAGLGVAMANAPEIVKKAAKEVTSSNNDDGIAVTLRKYFNML